MGGQEREHGPCGDHGGSYASPDHLKGAMPAWSSSPVDPVIGQLAALTEDAAEDSPGLLAMLASVAGPRHRRGVRHQLAVILGLAVCAVLAGARSFTAIAEWAAGADVDTLRALGVTGTVPSKSTFRRVLQRLDADAFDDLTGPRPVSVCQTRHLDRAEAWCRLGFAGPWRMMTMGGTHGWLCGCASGRDRGIC
jgi:DDE_Tnp_1-associated